MSTPNLQSSPDGPALVVRPGWSARLLLFVVGLVALLALGVSVWVYAQTRRDLAQLAATQTTLTQLATDLAQVRVSLDLYRQTAPAPADGTASADLDDLENRLAILEANWRDGAGTPATATLPPLAPPSAEAAATTDDCLPTGTRLLVSAGDSYPICGTPATISVLSVADGYITLQDGSTIATGGTLPLVGTACSIAVLPQGADAITGFAEIRATC